MKRIEEYRVLRKALEIIEKKEKSDIESMLEFAVTNNELEVILDEVCREYSVTVEEIKSKSRIRKINDSRQVAMHLLYKYTTMSLKEVGIELGRRDHTTVMHGLRSVQSNSWDQTYKAKMDKVEKVIQKYYGERV